MRLRDVWLVAVLTITSSVMMPLSAVAQTVAEPGTIEFTPVLGRVKNVLTDCPKKPNLLACRQCCSDTLDDDIYRRCIARCNATFD